jgi:hypothetical protein
MHHRKTPSYTDSEPRKYGDISIYNKDKHLRVETSARRGAK